jgi:hypothetical protein
MTNVFRKYVNRQIEIMTVRKRKKFLMWQNIIDSVLSQLLAIEVIKYHPEAACALRKVVVVVLPTYRLFLHYSVKELIDETKK